MFSTSGENCVFELFRRFGAPGHGRLGVNINRHAYAMPALVGRDLWIDLGIISRDWHVFCAHLNPADWRWRH